MFKLEKYSKKQQKACSFKEKPDDYCTSKTSRQAFNSKWLKKSTVFQKICYLSILNNSLALRDWNSICKGN